MTVANDFIDAEHANAIMDLAIPGFHYNRINNPTNDVLEKRIAALEDGTAALVVASGMAAVSYAILTVARAGSNFVVAPQLYGATYTYFAHVLSTLGIEARFAADDRAESIGALIDDEPCCVFVRVDRQSGRQRRGPRSRRRRRAPRRRAAHRRQHRRHAADAEADPPRRRRRRALADEVRRRSRHDPRRRHRRRRTFPVGRARRAISDVQRARDRLSRRRLRPRLSRAALRRAGPLHPTAQHRRHAVALQRLPTPPGAGDAGHPTRAPRGQRAGGRRLPGGRPARRVGEFRRISGQSRTTTWSSGT